MTEKNIKWRKEFVEKWFVKDSFDLSKVATKEEQEDQKNWRLKTTRDGGLVESNAQLFFIDETGCNRHTLRRKHGYSTKGKACNAKEGSFSTDKGLNCYTPAGFLHPRQSAASHVFSSPHRPRPAGSNLRPVALQLE